MSENGSRAPLRAVALADGRTAVVGQTYGAQVVMRAYHGRYDGDAKMWTFANAERASEAIAETVRLIERAKEPEGAATAAPSPA